MRLALRASHRFLDWNETLLHLPQYGIFHTAQWAEVLLRSYGLRVRQVCAVLGLESSTILLATVRDGLFGRKAVSLPFSDSCEILSTSDKASAMALEHCRIWAASKRLRSVEIRGGVPAGTEGSPQRFFFEHVIRLSGDPMDAWARFRDSTKRNIRKAERAGVVVTHSTTLRSMNMYYRLHCETRRRHGLPPQPRGFFHQIHEAVISQGQGYVALAWYAGRPVAGAVFLHFGRRAVYKFGASQFRHQDLRANNLLMWSAIRRYSENGFESLSLGRTDPEDVGLLQFKDGWTAKRSRLSYWVLFPGGSRQMKTSRLQVRLVACARAVARHLPTPLLRLAGALVYPYAA